jgi:hypothetical protein
LLSRYSVQKDLLEDYLSQRKALSPASVVRAMFSPFVLKTLRRQLNRVAPARLELRDVFNAIRDALSKEALLSAGDITLPKSRKKRRKTKDALRSAGEKPGPKRRKRQASHSETDAGADQMAGEEIRKNVSKDTPDVSTLSFSKGSEKGQTAV